MAVIRSENGGIGKAYLGEREGSAKGIENKKWQGNERDTSVLCLWKIRIFFALSALYQWNSLLQDSAGETNTAENYSGGGHTIWRSWSCFPHQPQHFVGRKVVF